MKSFILILLALIPLTIGADGVSKLKPFATDYCSMWPEGTSLDPEKWADCCFTHDLNYWLGGTEEERKVADSEILSCVKITGAPLEAFLMYIGVRIGGKPGDATFAWGYGWTKNRVYTPLERADIDNAKVLLRGSDYNQNPKLKQLIANFIDSVLSKK